MTPTSSKTTHLSARVKGLRTWRSLAFLCLASVGIFGCTATDSTNPVGSNSVATNTGTNAIDIAKSPNDHRQYRYIELPNKLRVLLVADSKSDKAAASLVALRGSFHEPIEFQGLAHFLEHMLFLGTEKYPEVGAYQNFISAHGGNTNAYTSLDHTNYFFDIQPEYFEAAMDRFAQFFIAPLLDPAYVDREKNAVHSEYQLQLKNDGWRAYLTQKLALNPDHPGSRFTIGSVDTLGEGVETELTQWFQDNYSADQMILVAIGPETLDSMEAWVTPMFGAIENKNIGPAPKLPATFRPGDLPVTLKLQALKDKDRVGYTFPIPSELKHFHEKPVLYLTNLLGHEGAGSLHQELKKRGWIESLSAGSDQFDDQTSMISINMGLTAEGYKRVPAITDLLFDYIEMLKTEPPQSRIFEEQAKVLGLAFQFQEQGSATGFVYRTAPMLAHYPPGELLRAPYLMDNFDPSLIQEYLGYLRPDNLMLDLSGPSITGDKIEPWFKVPYSLERAPIARKDVSATFKLPAANPFLPDDLSLLANDETQPNLIVDKPGLELWHDQDTEFGSPRANLMVTLGVAGGLTSIDDIVRATLFQALVDDALNEYAYSAYLAGLGYQVSHSTSGLELQLRGYSDKQELLLTRMLETIKNLDIDAQRLTILREELQDNWRSARTEPPYRQASSAINHLLVSSAWPEQSLAKAVAAVDVADLQTWRRDRLKSFSIQAVLHGNLQASDAQRIGRMLQKSLPIAQFPIVRPQIADAPTTARLPLKVDHQDAAMVLYVQDPDDKITTQAQSLLAVHFMRQAYFIELRTNQQLGYVVGASTKSLGRRNSVTFVVQSPVADPMTLEATTQTFVKDYAVQLAAMPADEFAEYRSGLIAELTEQDKNLAQRSNRYWQNLRLDYSGFDRSAQLAAAVAKISQPMVLEFIEQLHNRLPQGRLVAYSKGKFEQEPSVGRAIDSTVAYKQELLKGVTGAR